MQDLVRSNDELSPPPSKRQKTIGAVELWSDLPDTLPEDWKAAMSKALATDNFKKIISYLTKNSSKTIYPPINQVFSFASYCPLSSVKVVILGQGLNWQTSNTTTDPYHGPNQAHGLCFSVNPPTKPPPSLKNIFKELSSEFPSFTTPNHGNLESWAYQGVLLLNTTLTVESASANSHSKIGWETFTDSIIRVVNAKCPHAVFMLWGASAQKKMFMINTQKHLVLKSVHPSPLSASRGFLGCRHFSKANKFLEDSGMKAINWAL